MTQRRLVAALGVAVLAGIVLVLARPARPQQPQTLEYGGPKAPVPSTSPDARATPLPINLATALRLANSRSLDVELAAQRVALAGAQLDMARAAWLPTLTAGIDYLRHDGQIQDVGGKIFAANKSALYAGGGVNAIFAPVDAIYAPLAARQIVRARVADFDTVALNNAVGVAEAYFNVQQARGDLIGAEAAQKHAEELVRRTEKLADVGLVPTVETTRARSEFARRRQAVHAALERWRLASAELIRLLRLDPAVVIEPTEPPHLRVSLLSTEYSLDTLIPVGLRNRPELASQQAVVEATLTRLKQERMRPLIPSIVLRGPGTLGPGSFTGGVFGGGNEALANYAGRSDIELQVVWEFQNLLFGNRAKIKERAAENQIALLEHFRLQDRVAAEVAQAHAQARSAAERMRDAEVGLREAADSVEKNFLGLNQTRLAGEMRVLLVRPQEVIASIQTLTQAYFDYYGAIADHNRAQFRLYRALGHPANFISETPTVCFGRPLGIR